MSDSKIKLYRFHPMVIFRGGGYPLDSVEMTNWSLSMDGHLSLFESFSTDSIDKIELCEMVDANNLGEDKSFILGTIESCEVSKNTWKRYLDSDCEDFEIISYGCNYDFKIEKEKCFMPDGKKVSKKLYQSMY